MVASLSVLQGGNPILGRYEVHLNLFCQRRPYPKSAATIPQIPAAKADLKAHNRASRPLL